MSESDRPEPIAWAVFEHGERHPLALFTSRSDADLHASRKNDIGQRNCEAVPLYRQPTLTNAERDSIGHLCHHAKWCDQCDDLDAAEASTAEGLIRRLDNYE